MFGICQWMNDSMNEHAPHGIYHKQYLDFPETMKSWNPFICRLSLLFLMLPRVLQEMKSFRGRYRNRALLRLVKDAWALSVVPCSLKCLFQTKYSRQPLSQKVKRTSWPGKWTYLVTRTCPCTIVVNSAKRATYKGFLIFSSSLYDRHGGKVAGAALALTAVIIYTYYESGKSKTAVEDGLNEQMVIEPYEVNEIRFLNNLTPAVYESLSAACLDHFSTWSRRGRVSYPSFSSLLYTRIVLLFCHRCGNIELIYLCFLCLTWLPIAALLLLPELRSRFPFLPASTSTLLMFTPIASLPSCYSLSLSSFLSLSSSLSPLFQQAQWRLHILNSSILFRNIWRKLTRKTRRKRRV